MDWVNIPSLTFSQCHSPSLSSAFLTVNLKLKLDAFAKIKELYDISNKV